LVWLIYPTAYSFVMIFFKLTCDLGFFILESFSGFNCGSFKMFWDLGRWLIIAGQSQKALAAQEQTNLKGLSHQMDLTFVGM
jgi:hypothetical protein